MNWTDEERELAAQLHATNCISDCDLPVTWGWLMQARLLLTLPVPLADIAEAFEVWPSST